MRDWKSIVRQRLTPLGLTPAAESGLTEEISQHLEDSCRELLSGGASEEEAYQQAISELDDMYPLRAELEGSERMAKYEVVPPGDASLGNFMEDLWRDLRYALRTMRQSPIFVLFVVLTLGLGIGANTTVFTLINTLILNPLPVRNASELAAVAAADVGSTSKSATPFPISYPDLKDYRARNGVFGSFAGYTSPRVVTWQESGASQRMFIELSDRQLLLDVEPHTGQRTLLFAGGRQHRRCAPGCGNELRDLADPFWRRGGHYRQNTAAE